jgi:transcriptional regulator with XRE-family HTH domain
MVREVSAAELIRRGRLIREAREARGWSISKLARVVGVDRGQVSKIEAGKGGESLPATIACALALDMDLNLLFKPGLHNEPTGGVDDPFGLATA